MATPDQIPTDLALEIGEDLPPNEFMAAARHFFGYVEEVARAVNPDGEPVRWTVKVREGSAVLAAAAPYSAPLEVLTAIYGKVSATVDALSRGDAEGAGLGEAALAHLKGLSALTFSKRDRQVPVRIWIRKQPTDIGPAIANTIQEEWRVDYRDFGTVDGRLEAIQDQGGSLQIRIKDPLIRGAIRCYLSDEDLLQQALESFRHRVEISGVIHYRRNGVPISIDVARIERMPDDSELPTAADVRGILSQSQ